MMRILAKAFLLKKTPGLSKSALNSYARMIAAFERVI